MEIPVTTNNIILTNSKQIKRIGLLLMWTELIAIVWILNSLFSSPDWLTMSFIQYTITFTSLLLAIGILFLMYIYTGSLPKTDVDAIIFKQKDFEKPKLLRILITLQIVVILYSAYSADAWTVLEMVNLFELGGLQGIFSFVAFISLHLLAILGVVFMLKLIKFDRLLNNQDSEHLIIKKESKKRKLSLAISILLLLILTYRIANRVSLVTASAFSIQIAGSFSFYIFLSLVALAILAIYYCIAILTGKDFFQKKCAYSWLVALLCIDLYISIGLTISSLHSFLQYPEFSIPLVLTIVLELVFIVILLRLLICSIISSRYSFTTKAACTLQKAFAGNYNFNHAVGNADDENEEPWQSYLAYAVDSCDKHGDIHTYKEEAFLGWVTGDFFSPTDNYKNKSDYSEIEPFEKLEAIPKKIILDNATCFGFIWLLGTLPEARGKGMAKMLIEKTLNQMYKTDLLECWLCTESISNVCYYKNLGFSLFSEQVSDLGVTTYVMVSKLNERKSIV